MQAPAVDPAFERALSAEILVSEQMRMRVLAATLTVLLVADELLFLFARGALEQITQKPLPAWLPLRVIGPFLAYETVALIVLRHRRARGLGMPTIARFANAAIETSLPTVILLWFNQYASPAVAFGAWPTLLYFVFIAASTLRLDFALPAFTGAVAALGYLGVVVGVVSFTGLAADPVNYAGKAAIMVVAGIVAGLVAVRLRAKFRYAVEEAASRERVTNLFGQQRRCCDASRFRSGEGLCRTDTHLAAELNRGHEGQARDAISVAGRSAGGPMLFMVIERFPADPKAVYRRFRDKGRMTPDGLRVVDSWVTADLGRCFQLMECDDVALLQRWVAEWCDLAGFEIVPVVPGKRTAEALAETL